MAQPNSIFVTPSTTVVEVLQYQTPYTPVILNSYAYEGQVVSILDGNSSIGVLFSSIVVSTGTGTSFPLGAISTLINQPQGFVTLQSQAPNLWTFLNSFPFRNQYLSAGLYNLTTSTFTVARLSTIQTFTDSLAVEKLVVSGNFAQSSPITLNQTISSFGNVDLYSSFSVYNSSFFSSGLSTLGAVQLFSTVTVEGNVVSYSSLQFLSSVFISGSLSVVGNVSAGLISLSSGLVTRSLEVTGSSISTFLNAGSLEVLTRLDAKSEIRVGGDFAASTLILENLSTLSSLSIAGNLQAFNTKFYDTVSTEGAFHINTLLRTTDAEIIVNNALILQSTVTVGTSTQINGFLSASFAQLSTLVVLGDFQMTQNDLFYTSTLAVGDNLLTGNFKSLNTRIGETLSTTGSAYVYTGLSSQNLSTLGNTSSLVVYVANSVSSAVLSTSGNIIGSVSSTNTFISGDVNVLGNTFLTQATGIANTVYGSLIVRKDLFVGNTLQISSITLPQEVIANDFFVSSLNVGGQAVFAFTDITNIQASSIGTGGVMYPAFTMDMSNVLETLNFSTPLLSTLSFQARLCPPAVNSNETFFNISNSLAVAHPNVENRFDIGPLAVTSCNMRVSQVLSTSRIESDRISGIFQGDGSQLSNTNYRFDIVLKDLTLQSTLFSPTVETSSFTASTIVTTGFIPTSTFQVNELLIFGETAFPEYVSTGNQLFSISTPYIAGVVGDAANYGFFPLPQGSFFDTGNQVRLNTLMALGNNLGTNTTDDPRGVIINYDKIKDLGNNFLAWTLAVGGTLRVDSLPGVPLAFDEFRGDQLFLEGGGSFYPNSITPFYSLTNSGTTYISSGLISLSNLRILGDTLSTSGASIPNIIQTNASTLIFNSTLFVNRLNSSVGINTQPNFTLDVKDSAGALNIVLGTSSIIQNQIEFKNSPAEPVWLAAVGSDPYLRYAYIEDTDYWLSINLGTPIFNIFTTGGMVAPLDLFYFFQGYKFQTYIALGFTTILYNRGENILSESSWLPAIFSGNIGRTQFVDAEFNGVFWVAVGVYSNDYMNYPQATIVWSDGFFGDSWNPITAGGFNVNTNYAFYSQTFETGGRSVAWNGELWVAVGQGSNSYVGSNSGNNIITNNSILYSADGSNWSNASSGFGFTENVYNLNYSGGFGVVWTGINWVAVGFTALDTGILLSSDGKTWREVTGIGFSNYYSPGWGTAIAWNGNRLVASGYGSNAFDPYNTGVMLYSDTHGESWLTCSGDMIQASNIVWNGSYWLACGYNGVTRSEDGYEWTVTGLTDSTYGLMYNSNAVPVLQVGLNTDLLTVETVSAPPPSVTVAVGEESSYGAGNTMYYSSNGSNWTLVSGPKLTGAGNAVANGGGLWVAVGGNSNYYGTSNLYTSPDGQSWSPVNLDSLYFYYGNPVMRSVAYLNNIWLVGTDFDYSTYNSIIYSSNGTSWNAPIPSYFGYASLYIQTRGFAYGTNGFTGGNAYLAVGVTIYYYPAIIYSTNLNEWYYGYSSGFFNNTNLNYETNVYGILYANSTWYAVGVGDYATTCILYSGDATSWSNVTFATADFTAATAIAYNGTKWVAVGTTSGSGNTIKYSGDGTNWSDATGDFTTAAYSVIYNSNLSLWIATGEGNGSDTIKYSGDGETWSNNNGTVFNYGYGVAAGGAGAISSILSKRSFYNRLEVFRDPVPGVTTRLGTPYIAYASTILDLNNACQIDAGANTNNFKNGTLIYPFNSTLQNLQTTNISQSLSTNEFLFDCPLAINTQII